MVALTFDDGEEYGLVAQFLPVVSAAKICQQSNSSGYIADTQPLWAKETVLERERKVLATGCCPPETPKPHSKGT